MRRELLTVRQFAERHPAFTEAGLRWAGIRWLRSNGEATGFVSGFVQVGSRLLIDERQLLAALEPGDGGEP